VGEVSDRRAQKKAQTRDLIRTVAQQMFAEHGFVVVTIADIARTADVAVQTVFNHFATKEELFFDGRTPWVHGPADAVRSRELSVPPLAALRAYLIDVTGSLVNSLRSPERQCYIATIEACDGLRAHERELVFQSERRLAAALLEAWTDGRDESGTPAPADPETVAPLTAAAWLAPIRALITDKRSQVIQGADPAELGAELAAELETLVNRLQDHIESVLSLRRSRADELTHAWTGRPRRVPRGRLTPAAEVRPGPAQNAASRPQA
jgi:AcrR family transcriptional regulator